MTQETIEEYGYKIATWNDFLTAIDKPTGLLERAISTTNELSINTTTAYVLYDPEDDEDGFMLIGSKDMLVKEGTDHINRFD